MPRSTGAQFLNYAEIHGIDTTFENALREAFDNNNKDPLKGKRLKSFEDVKLRIFIFQQSPSTFSDFVPLLEPHLIAS